MLYNLLVKGKFLFILLADALICQCAFSQQEVPPVPSTKPAVGAHWMIDYTKEAAASDKPASDKSSKAHAGVNSKMADQSATKLGKSILSEEYHIAEKVAYVTKKYTDHSERVIYIIDRIAYEKNVGTTSVLAVPLSGTDEGEILFTQHYPGVEWLQARYYVGMEQQGEHSCLHFRRPASSKTPAGTVSQSYNPFNTSLECEAWIDETTKLPHSFRQGTVRGTYQHQAEQDDPIEVPEDIARAIKHYNGET